MNSELKKMPMIEIGKAKTHLNYFYINSTIYEIVKKALV